MAESFIHPLGAWATSASKADLNLRLYLDGVGPLADPGITVTETATAGTFAIGGLPDAGEGAVYELTGEYGGVTFSFRWPRAITFAPAAIVLPVRATGESLGSLGVKLYKNGVLNAATLTLAELVAGAGDYAVSGFPDEPGTWAAEWSHAGLNFAAGWVIATDASADPFGWLDADFERITTIFESWSESDVYHPDRLFDEPQHTGDPSDPAKFTTFALEYDRPEYASFDTNLWPDRTGIVRVTFWLEPGSGAGHKKSMRTALAALFGVADTDAMVFYPPQPYTVGAMQRNRSWSVEGMVIPFRGIPG